MESRSIFRPMQDPNFPPNLSIKPLHITADEQDSFKQDESIAKYGIAGRVWEATELLVNYLTPLSFFEPPCSLFTKRSNPLRILELGSGQCLASLHLASQLSTDDTLVLTDLPNVVELCNQSVSRWRNEQDRDGGRAANIQVEPLAWGESIDHLSRFMPFTHILMCDLIYFPHLYPLLLRTILELSEPEVMPTEGDTFGPEIILSYMSRTLALEESFFDSLSLYFHLEPVRPVKPPSRTTPSDPTVAVSQCRTSPESEVKIFICRRWRITEDWILPHITKVMNGSSGVIRGRSYGLVDDLFGNLEWEA